MLGSLQSVYPPLHAEYGSSLIPATKSSVGSQLTWLSQIHAYWVEVVELVCSADAIGILEPHEARKSVGHDAFTAVHEAWAGPGRPCLVLPILSRPEAIRHDAIIVVAFSLSRAGNRCRIADQSARLHCPRAAVGAPEHPSGQDPRRRGRVAVPHRGLSHDLVQGVHGRRA